MIYIFLFIPFMSIILSACAPTEADVIPHNVIYFENYTVDTVSFSFNETNRLTEAEWERGAPIRLSNHSFLTLETDFNIILESFDEGWEEMETIDTAGSSEPYFIERSEDIDYIISASDVESSLEEGRYRLVVDYTLINDEGESEHSHTIGAVFWIQSEVNQSE